MRRVQVLIVVAASLAASQASGVMGCLTPEEELARRADLVVVGKIESVEKVALDPCPEAPLEAGRLYPRNYPKCGGILGFVVSTETELRGSAPARLFVLVPLPFLPMLSLTCDDRPELEAMSGRHAVLFLESSGGQFWSLDGPDSIYCGRDTISTEKVDQLRKLLRTIPRRKA